MKSHNKTGSRKPKPALMVKGVPVYGAGDGPPGIKMMFVGMEEGLLTACFGLDDQTMEAVRLRALATQQTIPQTVVSALKTIGSRKAPQRKGPGELVKKELDSVYQSVNVDLGCDLRSIVERLSKSIEKQGNTVNINIIGSFNNRNSLNQGNVTTRDAGKVSNRSGRA